MLTVLPRLCSLPYMLCVLYTRLNSQPFNKHPMGCEAQLAWKCLFHARSLWQRRLNRVFVFGWRFWPV